MCSTDCHWIIYESFVKGKEENMSEARREPRTLQRDRIVTQRMEMSVGNAPSPVLCTTLRV